MWMQDERSGEPTEEQPSISHTFRHVYRFILRAMQGDTAVVSALFQQYVAGELPEKLLALSRRCVQEDQAALRARRSKRPAGSRNQRCAPRKAVLRQRPVSSRTSAAHSRAK
jgi:hypothetical protein